MQDFDVEEMLDVFQEDPNYVESEAKYREIRAEILVWSATAVCARCAADAVTHCGGYSCGSCGCGCGARARGPFGEWPG